MTILFFTGGKQSLELCVQTAYLACRGSRQWVLAGGSSFTVAFCRDTVGPSARRFQVLLPPPHCECPSLKPPRIIYISLTVATAGAWGWVSSSQGGGCRPFLSTAAARESRRAAKQVCVCVSVCVEW